MHLLSLIIITVLFSTVHFALIIVRAWIIKLSTFTLRTFIVLYCHISLQFSYFYILLVFILCCVCQNTICGWERRDMRFALSYCLRLEILKFYSLTFDIMNFLMISVISILDDKVFTTILWDDDISPLKWRILRIL